MWDLEGGSEAVAWICSSVNMAEMPGSSQFVHFHSAFSLSSYAVNGPRPATGCLIGSKAKLKQHLSFVVLLWWLDMLVFLDFHTSPAGPLLCWDLHLPDLHYPSSSHSCLRCNPYNKSLISIMLIMALFFWTWIQPTWFYGYWSQTSLFNTFHILWFLFQSTFQ